MPRYSMTGPRHCEDCGAEVARTEKSNEQDVVWCAKCAGLRKCNYMERATSLAAREVGCPLDHCECGTHDSNNEEHNCPPPPTEEDEEVRNAERAAGWDPNP